MLNSRQKLLTRLLPILTVCQMWIVCLQLKIWPNLALIRWEIKDLDKSLKQKIISATTKVFALTKLEMIKIPIQTLYYRKFLKMKRKSSKGNFHGKIQTKCCGEGSAALRQESRRMPDHVFQLQSKRPLMEKSMNLWWFYWKVSAWRPDGRKWKD